MLKRILGIFTLIVTIFVLLAGLIYWLELINVIPSKLLVNFITGMFNRNETVELENVSDILLLEKIRLEKQYEALRQEREKLEEYEQALLVREEEIEKNEETIRIKEEELNARELSLNLREKTIENKDERIRYNVISLLNMPPASAVEIMMGYDDQQLIDTLIMADKIAEENQTVSSVPYWFSLMDSERASEIQKKILYR